MYLHFVWYLGLWSTEENQIHNGATLHVVCAITASIVLTPPLSNWKILFPALMSTRPQEKTSLKLKYKKKNRKISIQLFIGVISTSFCYRMRAWLERWVSINHRQMFHWKEHNYMLSAQTNLVSTMILCWISTTISIMTTAVWDGHLVTFLLLPKIWFWRAVFSNANAKIVKGNGAVASLIWTTKYLTSMAGWYTNLSDHTSRWTTTI